MRDGRHAAKRNPTASAMSNEPRWRAVCTGSPASEPRSSAGTATPICTSARTARIQRSASCVSSPSGAARRRRWRRGSPGVRSGIAGAGARRSCAVERARRRGEAAALGAGVEVGVDRGVVDAGVLAVEPGGDRVTDVQCSSYRVSRFEGSGVPPVSSVAVDELTRLFLAARDGDRTALLQAIRASQADVWRLACHLVGPNEADDVTQDTFVRAWRALPAFRGDSSARTWLLAIARRACADAVRRTVRRRRLAAPGRAAARPTPARPRGDADRRARGRRRSSTARPRPAGRVRAHPDGRVLVRGGGRGLRRAGRHHPVAGRARARAARRRGRAPRRPGEHASARRAARRRARRRALVVRRAS